MSSSPSDAPIPPDAAFAQEEEDFDILSALPPGAEDFRQPPPEADARDRRDTPAPHAPPSRPGEIREDADDGFASEDSAPTTDGDARPLDILATTRPTGNESGPVAPLPRDLTEGHGFAEETPRSGQPDSAAAEPDGDDAASPRDARQPSEHPSAAPVPESPPTAEADTVPFILPDELLDEALRKAVDNAVTQGQAQSRPVPVSHREPASRAGAPMAPVPPAPKPPQAAPDTPVAHPPATGDKGTAAETDGLVDLDPSVAEALSAYAEPDARAADAAPQPAMTVSHGHTPTGWSPALELLDDEPLPPPEPINLDHLEDCRGPEVLEKPSRKTGRYGTRSLALGSKSGRSTGKFSTRRLREGAASAKGKTHGGAPSHPPADTPKSDASPSPSDRKTKTGGGALRVDGESGKTPSGITKSGSGIVKMAERIGSGIRSIADRIGSGVHSALGKTSAIPPSSQPEAAPPPDAPIAETVQSPAPEDTSPPSSVPAEADTEPMPAPTASEPSVAETPLPADPDSDPNAGHNAGEDDGENPALPEQAFPGTDDTPAAPDASDDGDPFADTGSPTSSGQPLEAAEETADPSAAGEEAASAPVDPADVFAALEAGDAAGDDSGPKPFDPASIFAQFNDGADGGALFDDDPELAALQAEYKSLGEADAEAASAEAEAAPATPLDKAKALLASLKTLPRKTLDRAKAIGERLLAWSRVREYWWVYVDVAAAVVATASLAVILSWLLWYAGRA